MRGYLIQIVYIVIAVTLDHHVEGQPTTSVADKDEKSCRSVDEDYYALKNELSHFKVRLNQLEALLPRVEGSMTLL